MPPDPIPPPRGTPHEVERSFEAPARALEGTLEAVERSGRALGSKKVLKRAGEYWSTLGPGLTTGAADDDPSGIATYSQAGAQYGFGLIWTALFTYPFMAVVQEMCARIGVVSGEGLAANIRRHFPRNALYVVTILLFAANTLNIAADLGAMAASTRLLLPGAGAELLVVLFAFITLGLQIFTTYAQYAKYLKYLALALFSYIIVAFSVHLDWGAVLHATLVPHLSFTKNQLFLLAAVLGTTISPYLFFWQTSQEVEEDIMHGGTSIKARKQEATPRAVSRMRTDVWSGMLFSNLITFFIFAACAGTLFAVGDTHIRTAADAARALKPFGEFAYLLFTIGVVGTGLLAVPVLAGSTAYAIAESMGWKYGLYRKLKQAYAFYGVIIVSMIAGVAMDFMHLDPIKGLIWAAVGNGVIAPVVLYFVVKLSSDKKIMGEHANGFTLKCIGWATVILMAASGIAAIWTLF